jgi:hypothetical protein
MKKVTQIVQLPYQMKMQQHQHIYLLLLMLLLQKQQQQQYQHSYHHAHVVESVQEKAVVEYVPVVNARDSTEGTWSLVVKKKKDTGTGAGTGTGTGNRDTKPEFAKLTTLQTIRRK